MINQEKLNRLNKELEEMQIHHENFKKVIEELGLTTNDIVEVYGPSESKTTGYFNHIEIYYRPWGQKMSSIIHLNKIKKDGTKSKVSDCAFGPFTKINIINK